VRYVLDCSVAVKWFVPETLSDIAELALSRHETGELSFIAPNSITAEFGHSMRKNVIRKTLEPETALASLAQFLRMEIELVPAEPLATEALRLALLHNATFYDALYLALAEREDLLVLTADNPLVNAFARLARTHWLGDFR
jgi:predicted nucleic acid-binding protein